MSYKPGVSSVLKVLKNLECLFKITIGLGRREKSIPKYSKKVDDKKTKKT